LPYGHIKLTRAEDKVIGKMFVSVDTFQNRCEKMISIAGQMVTWMSTIQSLIIKADEDGAATVMLVEHLDDFLKFLGEAEHNIKSMKITRDDIVGLTSDDSTQLIRWFDANTKMMEDFVAQGHTFIERIREGSR